MSQFLKVVCLGLFFVSVTLYSHDSDANRTKRKKPKKFVYNIEDRSLRPYPYGKMLPSQVTLRRPIPLRGANDLTVDLKRAPASMHSISSGK